MLKKNYTFYIECTAYDRVNGAVSTIEKGEETFNEECNRDEAIKIVKSMVGFFIEDIKPYKIMKASGYSNEGYGYHLYVYENSETFENGIYCEVNIGFEEIEEG